jgi:hypothetical protein
VAKAKTTGRPRAGTSGKGTGKRTGASTPVPRSLKTDRTEKTRLPTDRGAAKKPTTGKQPLARTKLPPAVAHTIVQVPALRRAGQTDRPPLGVMPGMRALSKTQTTAMPAVPAPPPPTIALPPRDELLAPREIGRLLRYGEKLGDHRIDIRMLPLQLPVTSGALGVCDPAVPKTWRVLDRPSGPGQFRVMLSVAKSGNEERLAAIVIHLGRPPIAKWTVAHYKGQKKPRSPDASPRVPVTSEWIAIADGGEPIGALPLPEITLGTPEALAPVEVPLVDGRKALAFPCAAGDHAAYWAIDAQDKPVCLVIELDIFKQKDWKPSRPG